MELFVGGSTVEELEVDGRVASVEAGRVETLSSLSKSRISIFNAHLTLFVRRMTSHNSIGMYCHLIN